MLLALSDPAWITYPDCYGSGLLIAEHLRALEEHPLQIGAPGDEGPWSHLWARLARDTEVSLAAYAAVPHIVRLGAAVIAEDAPAVPLDYLHLPTWIEITRLTSDSAPEIPPALETAYYEAISALDDLAIGYALRSSDLDVARVVSAALLVARGDVGRAEVVLDWDDHDIEQAQQYLLDGPAFGVN
ncbi:MAG TPA: hypothetical protein VGN14_18335 [Candidatus Elarobacter sp.]|jgi:hypothetical protein